MHALKWILGLVLIFVAMALFFTLRTPTHLYAISGKFTDCPARPSCVSSIATDEPHAIAPLPCWPSMSAACPARASSTSNPAMCTQSSSRPRCGFMTIWNYWPETTQ